MKFGLLTYKTENLGDYIQSLAAMQFLPKIDYFIERDKISRFNKKETKIILNGWFMEEKNSRGLLNNRNPLTRKVKTFFNKNKFNWPPKKNINPLFISFHLAKPELLNKKTIKYLKKFEPIGCRDIHTLNLLKEKNIESYFSGCLTLTFKNKLNFRNNNIYFVDPFGWIRGFPKPEDKNFPKELWNNFPKKLRENSIFISHSTSEKNPIKRLKKAKQLLDIYSQAKLVITGRLHCALPCLAFGTPVIFINQKFYNSRTVGLINLMNHINIEDIQNNNLNINWKNLEKNPVDVSEISENLIKKCKEFIEK